MTPPPLNGPRTLEWTQINQGWLGGTILGPFHLAFLGHVIRHIKNAKYNSDEMFNLIKQADANEDMISASTPGAPGSHLERKT